MNATQLDITLLCKVVDNFGDIGTVYRLTRALSDLQRESPFPEMKIRIVTDNLSVFAQLAPAVDASADVQTVCGWKVYNWNAADVCLQEFQKRPPFVVLECFQCGRPDWLDALLFDIKTPAPVHIIMIDYLTAEPYAETFHRMPSLTRSARVTKVNFMPGFTEKTGGLILDRPFMQALKLRPPHSEMGARNFGNAESAAPFEILFFAYEMNCAPVVRALANFKAGNVKSLVAQGAGCASFIEAWEREGKPFALERLPFLEQLRWDELLCRTPLLFVRGEDSLSRACLCGSPFVWHAYPQSEDYQLVKVKALLERMRPFFSAEDFPVIDQCWLSFNGDGAAELETTLGAFLSSYERLCSGFAAFAESVKKSGDLARNVLTFIEKNYILAPIDYKSKI